MNIDCLSLAPIQGITDYHFRNIFFRHFGALNKAYTPFVRFHDINQIRKSQLTDIQSANNNLDYIVPQIISNQANEILFLAGYLQEQGYKEMNWNLGCPFPMVVRRQLGSGLLPYPERIDHILNQVFAQIKISLSIKMRLGYQCNEEIFPVLDVLEKYPVSEIIIHPRIGKQMYTGEVDIHSFKQCVEKTRHKLCYNGDIDTVQRFKSLQSELKTITNWMIGRAAISNPFIFEDIISIPDQSATSRNIRFAAFHFDLFEKYSLALSGPGHLLIKMQHLWEYFSEWFENPHKVFKMIKKSGNVAKYQAAVQEIFNSYGKREV